MAQVPQVQVVGLRALLRDLGKMSSDTGPLLKLLRQAGMTAAAPVAAATRSTLPEVSGRLAGDVRVSATKSGAAVRMGRSNLRYAGWVEFGGTRKVPRVSTRDYHPRGRYLFPAAVQLAAVSARLYSDAVTQAIEEFPWTNETNDPGGVHD